MVAIDGRDNEVDESKTIYGRGFVVQGLKTA